ncbi:MgtC/SapB family protein [Ochrobactrum daejeonense]|nr:MgtC/SapB family protein [Brucella daejeonensis]
MTSVIAAMATFALGVLAVLGNQTFAAAGGVALVSLLASRHVLHAFMRALTWEELRSAIIFLAMIYVVWPVIPAQKLNYFGGLSLSDIWTLVMLLAGISFAGYVALRLLGGKLGQILAGGLGGLVSSTAVTLTNARLSGKSSAPDALVAGALAANSVSLLKTLLLSALLSNSLALRLAPALLVTILVLAAGAWLMVRNAGEEPAFQLKRNPFQLTEVLKLAALITVVTVAARIASDWFGHVGLVSVSALSGIADTDAVIVSIAGLIHQITPDLAATSIGGALVTNTIAKSSYAVLLGSRMFSRRFLLFSIISLMAGVSIFYAVPIGGGAATQ